MARSRAVLVSLVLAIGLAACAAPAASIAPAASVGGTGRDGGTLTVAGAWIRAAARGATTAAYLRIDNGTAAPDTLVAVTTDVATASLHETSTDASGMTGMRHTDGVPVPAGGSAVLEPGGHHVMLEGLATDLAAGSIVRLVLTFERAGAVEVAAEVRAGG